MELKEYIFNRSLKRSIRGSFDPDQRNLNSQIRLLEMNIELEKLKILKKLHDEKI